MCDECDWTIYLEAANEMLNDESYEHVYNTIKNIAKRVEENRHITNDQREALEDIYNTRCF